MNSEVDKNSFIFDIVWERICKLTGWKNYGQLAEFLGIKAQSVSGAKQRGFISLDWVFKVAQGYNVSTDWLATGKGAREIGAIDTGAQLAGDQAAEWNKIGDYVQVPRYEIAASAGAGAVVQSEQIVDYLAFKSEWLKVSLGLSPANAAVISVIGDSMEPYLFDGDLILVDTGISRISNDSVYVLQYDESLLVKRIQRKGDGTVVVKSDNPLYEPEIFRGDAADRLRVVGRLVRRLVR